MNSAVILSLGSSIVAFTAGWYLASDAIRREVYSRRFDAYQKLMDAATKVMTTSISASVDAQFKEAMYSARLELMAEQSRQSLHLSQRAADSIPRIYEATAEPDVEAIRAALNAMIEAMAHDLRLKAVELSTAALLPNRRR